MMRAFVDTQRSAMVLGIGLSLAFSFGCSSSGTQPTDALDELAAATPRAQATASTACDGELHIELTYPGASPAELEESAVLPVERALSSVPGVTQVSALILEGHADVWLHAPATSIASTHTQVVKALDALTSLPTDLEGPTVDLVRRSVVTHAVIIRGSSDFSEEMVATGSDALYERMRDTAGVRGIQRLGRTPEIVSVVATSARLRAAGVTVAQLAAAVGASPVHTPTTDASDDSRLLARGRVNDEALERRVVKVRPDGSRLYLSDLATISRHSDPRGARAWTAAGAAQIWLVDTEDPKALRGAVVDAQAQFPSGLGIELAGQLEIRGCPSSPADLDGNFDVLTIEAIPDREVAQGLAVRVSAPGAVWLWGESLAGARPYADPPALQLLIASQSEHKSAVLESLATRPDLAVFGHYGPARQHLRIELKHKDPAALNHAESALLGQTWSRGLQASGGPQLQPQVNVDLRPETAAGFGLSQSEIAEQVRFALHGLTVAQLQEGERIVSVRIEPEGGPTAAPREKLARLRDLQLDTRSGRVVPLSAVASVQRTDGYRQITRRDGARVRDVLVSVPAEKLDATKSTIDSEILPALRREHVGLEAQLR